MPEKQLTNTMSVEKCNER